MKAPAFDYVRPRTLPEALALLAEYGEEAKILAGGQSLVPALNLRLLAPRILIDVNGLTELEGVEVRGDRLRVGALTRHAELSRSEAIATHAPLLAEAVRHVAHPAIRNRGTLGGNLAHADPASELPACMVALDATLIVTGPRGERRIAAADFFTGIYATALSSDEILTAVDLPGRKAGERHAFLELSRRSGDYALVGIAIRASLASGVPTGLRPVFFAVGDRPILAAGAATLLEGRSITDARVDEAVAALAEDLEPADDLQITAATRLYLAGVVLRRAIRQLLGAAAPIPSEPEAA